MGDSGLFQRLRKTTTIKISGVLAEIRTRHLLNTNQKLSTSAILVALYHAFCPVFGVRTSVVFITSINICENQQQIYTCQCDV
jgi:hypothetical protein